MVRRRGELSKAMINRDWPHQVGLPNTEVGRQHSAIKAFCADLSLCNRGHTFARGHEYINVFCFSDPEHAQRFAERFGGEMVDPKTRPRWPGKSRRRTNDATKASDGR